MQLMFCLQSSDEQRRSPKSETLRMCTFFLLTTTTPPPPSPHHHPPLHSSYFSEKLEVHQPCCQTKISPPSCAYFQSLFNIHYYCDCIRCITPSTPPLPAPNASPRVDAHNHSDNKSMHVVRPFLFASLPLSPVYLLFSRIAALPHPLPLIQRRLLHSVLADGIVLGVIESCIA